MVPFKSLFIDDLCVDQNYERNDILGNLFEYSKKKQKQLGCYEVTLNVWAEILPWNFMKNGNTDKERQMEYV